MDKRRIRIAAAAAAGLMGAFTGVGAASAAPVQAELADLTQVSLAEVRKTDNSVLANSLLRVASETGTGEGINAGWQSAPPAAFGS